jgi:hypothetical protein
MWQLGHHARCEVCNALGVWPRTPYRAAAKQLYHGLELKASSGLNPPPLRCDISVVVARVWLWGVTPMGGEDSGGVWQLLCALSDTATHQFLESTPHKLNTTYQQ